MLFRFVPMTTGLLLTTVAGVLLGALAPAPMRAQAAPAGAQAPLQPGDAIIVRLPGDSVMRDTLFLEASGRIALPRIGPIDLGTTAARDVPALIRQALSTVARGQDALVRPLRRVTVVGEVMKPGVLYLDPAATLRDAVAQAGAFSTVADNRSIALLRQGATTRIRNWQLAVESSAPIASGDVIAIPREAWLRRNILNVSSSILLVVTTFVAASR
jgi:polysaccharide export outer membrane protein